MTHCTIKFFFIITSLHKCPFSYLDIPTTSYHHCTIKALLHHCLFISTCTHSATTLHVIATCTILSSSSIPHLTTHPTTFTSSIHSNCSPLRFYHIYIPSSPSNP